MRAKHDIEGGDIKKHVTAILDQSEDLGMLRNRGFMLNEVMMFDDIDGPVVKADSIQVRALNGVEEWGPSDHCRLEIVVV